MGTPFFHHLYDSLAQQVGGTFWLAPISLTSLPFLCYFVTTLRFHYVLWANSRRTSHKIIPIAPYWFPFLYHAIPMALYPAPFISGLTKKYGISQPFGLRVGFMKMTLIADPDHVQQVMKNARTFTNKPLTLFVLDKLLAAPKTLIARYASDDSGLATKPRVGSSVLLDDRIYYFQIRTTHKYLAGVHLHALNDRYPLTLGRHLDNLSISPEAWTSFPDLYRFLQLKISPASVETVFGSKLLDLHPSFMEDFWTFEVNSSRFLRGTPSWLAPGPYRARKNLIETLKSWQAHAAAHFDCTRTGPSEPEWEPNFGAKLIRTRQADMNKMAGMDPDARATEHLGLLFGLNASALPPIFWFVYHAFKDPVLLQKLRKEVADSTSPEGRLDMAKLVAQPLAQSVYAEVLRLYVAITINRHAEVGSIHFSGYEVKEGGMVMMYSRIGAMNTFAWEQAGRELAVTKAPLESFCAERFLDEQEVFSMDGLSGIWLPFGGGDRMCPGRYFAKAEMLATFALFVERFEVEILEEGGEYTGPDMGSAPFGALPPGGKVPFRIRRRGEVKG
ncbi:cytochrome P450 [Podospora australis]|uniref:Cytochrome P450 n=1 Tax=Podospora australis TaxID=1536484 RepID=A0AAN7APC7_9PEZI|nr:cytochrome P450 [Podospora australis]